MVVDVGRLVAHIGLDNRELQVGLAKSQRLLGQFGGVISKVAGSALLPLAGVATGVYGVATAIHQLVDATKLAARIEVMNHVLEMTGERAGYTERELKGVRDRIMALGIATKEAIHIEQLFIQSELKIADALKISRAAQDLAVISGQNSSEAAETLTQAIVAQRPILLKQFGIIASLDKMYDDMARTLGKNREALTENEKRQAFMNEILRQSATVAGSYETAMRDVGKLVTSLPRYFDEAAEAVGQHFLPVMERVVHTAKDVLEGITGMFQSTEQATEKFYAARDAFEDKSKAAMELAQRYDELSVKANLNATEQAELKTIIEQLTAIMPAAAGQWDEANRVIGINTDRVRANIEQKRALFRVEEAETIKEWAKEWGKLTEELDKFQDLASKSVPAVPKVQFDLWKLLTGQFAPYKVGLVDVNETVAATHETMKDLTVALSQGFDAVNNFAGTQKYLAKIMDPILANSLTKAIAELQKEDIEAKKARETIEGLGKTLEITSDQLKEFGDTFREGSYGGSAFATRLQSDVDEMRKTDEDALQKQKEAAAEAAEYRKSLIEGLPERQLELDRQILESDAVTSAERGRVWMEYADLRSAQIGNELKELEQAGASQELIQRTATLRFAELEEEKRQAFGETIDWMVQATRQMAEGMQQSLSSTFFDWFEGRVEGLRGIVSSLADQMMQVLSRIAAEKLASSVMNLIPGFQHGGIVTSPTLAMIGERGPEAVIPLSHRGDDKLWSRIAPALEGTRGRSKPVNVNINISTPDPASFRNSQSQIAAQAAVAMAAAGRNL